MSDTHTFISFQTKLLRRLVDVVRLGSVGSSKVAMSSSSAGGRRVSLPTPLLLTLLVATYKEEEVKCCHFTKLSRISETNNSPRGCVRPNFKKMRLNEKL